MKKIAVWLSFLMMVILILPVHGSSSCMASLPIYAENPSKEEITFQIQALGSSPQPLSATLTIQDHGSFEIPLTEAGNYQYEITCIDSSWKPDGIMVTIECYYGEHNQLTYTLTAHDSKDQSKLDTLHFYPPASRHAATGEPVIEPAEPVRPTVVSQPGESQTNNPSVISSDDDTGSYVHNQPSGRNESRIEAARTAAANPEGSFHLYIGMALTSLAALVLSLYLKLVSQRSR